MTKKNHKVAVLDFSTNEMAVNVCGPHEKHLKHIQSKLPQVVLKALGHEVFIEGDEQFVDVAHKILSYLKEIAGQQHHIQAYDVEHIVQAYLENKDVNFNDLFQQQLILSSQKKKIYPRTFSQKNYIHAILHHDIVFGVGPAGTGKTYLAMAVGMTKLLKGEVEKIILTRPAVEAGEKLGFLPGDLAEKVNPYLRPLYDALYDLVDREKANRMIAAGQIEVAPLAFMRGRTLSKSYIILDEAQNCTREQMKMFLTRLGFESQAVVTGDVTQVDLPRGVKSGLIQAIKILQGIRGMQFYFFTEKDVVRHPLVAEIVKAYQHAEQLPS